MVDQLWFSIRMMKTVLEESIPAAGRLATAVSPPRMAITARSLVYIDSTTTRMSLMPSKTGQSGRGRVAANQSRDRAGKAIGVNRPYLDGGLGGGVDRRVYLLAGMGCSPNSLRGVFRRSARRLGLIAPTFARCDQRNGVVGAVHPNRLFHCGHYRPAGGITRC